MEVIFQSALKHNRTILLVRHPRSLGLFFFLHLSRKIRRVLGFRCCVVAVSVHRGGTAVLSAPFAGNNPPHDRPLAGDLDTVREEFHGTVAGDIHVPVLATGPVQPSKRKGLAGDRNPGCCAIRFRGDTNTQHQTSNEFGERNRIVVC